MKKIAIITREHASSWKSCQVISSNLLQAYYQAFEDCEVKLFGFDDDDCNLYAMHRIATELVNYCPDHLVFMEHQPHPGKILEFVDEIGGENFRPEIIFHLYGDFPLFVMEWAGLSNILINYDVKFLCASDAQVSFIRQFINRGEVLVNKCPFPVDATIFNYNAQIRASAREKLNISDEQVYIYTGRISHQKQVLELIYSFANFLKSTSANAVLMVAGEFDDLGVPYLNYTTCPNTYYTRYAKMMRGFDPEVQKRIRYLGNLEEKELVELYNAADQYLSLSVHNDEDFGMAPAEAMCNGLPSVLTNWGGYASFHLEDIKNACMLIPVEIDEADITFQENYFIKCLFKRSSENHSDERRQDISTRYLQSFSIQAVAELLKNYYRSPRTKFSGYSEILSTVVSRVTTGAPTFMEMKRRYNDIYRDVYASYIP